MAADDLRRRFLSVRTGKSNGGRAPHKPLLLLLAIGRCVNGQERLVPFAKAHDDLTALSIRYSPQTGPVRTQYPFWRLQSDRVWEVEHEGEVQTTSSGDAYVPSLQATRARGGLMQADYDMMRQDPALALEIADALITRHFTPSLRDPILADAGFLDARTERGIAHQGDEHGVGEPEVAYVFSRRRPRDARFSGEVLAAYGERCAVCEFSTRLNGHVVGLEAAHIHWHSHQGPDEVPNGLALCALHHNLFDLGAFTVLPELRVALAGNLSGTGFDEALGQFDDRPLRAPPKRRVDHPANEFLDWHAREVFHRPD